MAESELSLKERDHLYKLSVIPFLIMLYVFMAYLVYLLRADTLKTAWDVFVLWGLPYSIIGPTALFLTFEVLYYRRVRKEAKFHARRFIRRTFLTNAGVLSFFTFMVIFDITLSETFGKERAFLLFVGVWSMMFLVVALKLGRQQLRRILGQA